MALPQPDWRLVVTVLGSGTSQGVPMIGCHCSVCRSADPRDKRSRSSIYLETPEACILVDTTPTCATRRCARSSTGSMR